MKNGAKILCIIGGVFNVLVVLALVVVAMFLFRVSSNPENLKQFYDESGGELTAENAKIILMAIKGAALVILLVGMFELIGCVACFLGAFDLDSKPLMALVIMMCLFACNPFGILAGIFGLIGEPAPAAHQAHSAKIAEEHVGIEQTEAPDAEDAPKEEKEAE